MRGLALFLVFAGIFLALVGILSALATGDRRLMLLATAGFALQLVGWRGASQGRGAA